MSKVVIFGIGDYGRIAQLYLERDSQHDVVAFTAHGEYVDRDELNGLPIVPFEELGRQHPPDAVSMLVAAGFSKVNQVRSAIYEGCKGLGYELITYVSSQAMVWPDVPIGDNCFIFEANVVQPGVTIGNDVVLWSGNHIGHDVTIGHHCFIASHAVISGQRHHRRSLLRRGQRHVPRRRHRGAALRHWRGRADYERHGGGRRVRRARDAGPHEEELGAPRLLTR